MKRLILIFFTCSSFAGFASLGDTGCSYAGFESLRVIGCFSESSASLCDFGCSLDSLPDLNRSILSFVDSKMHKKVGRGECWDLAAEALNSAGAKWNGKLNFGRKLEKGEEILPGDIIQFEGVKIKFTDGNAKYTQVMKHHTGIIYSIKGKNQFDMANQNTAEHGRKVSLIFIDLEDVSSGHYYIYRPVKE